MKVSPGVQYRASFNSYIVECHVRFMISQNRIYKTLTFYYSLIFSMGPHPATPILFATPKYTRCATGFGKKYLRCALAILCRLASSNTKNYNIFAVPPYKMQSCYGPDST